MADDTLKRCQCRPDCTSVIGPRGTRFAWGHNGRCASAETREKISESHKNNPQFRAAMAKRSLNLGWRQALRESHLGKKPKWTNPEQRIRRIAETNGTRKARKAFASITAESWRDPMVRLARRVGISATLRGKLRGEMPGYHRKAIGKGNRLAYREGRRTPTVPNKWHRHVYRGVALRSSWELAFAKQCDIAKVAWEYEGYVFKLGRTTYTPDFYLPKFDLFVEVKGYHSPKFWHKVVEFHQKFPSRRLIIADHALLRKWGIL